uniref:Uncharacterized protein n=1 Tax=Mustela putorius furo TaxID=9669 RepID=M3YMT6_MUSPF
MNSYFQLLAHLCRRCLRTAHARRPQATVLRPVGSGPGCPFPARTCGAGGVGCPGGNTCRAASKKVNLENAHI